MANVTLDDVMNLAQQVKSIDAQNFVAGDQILEMLRRQQAAAAVARTEFAATIEVKDTQIAQRNADYVALNERNTEIGQRLATEQSERQGLAATLSVTNTLLAETITDVAAKTQLLAEAAAADAEAKRSFDAYKESTDREIARRDQQLGSKESEINQLTYEKQSAAQLYQDNLDAIAAQFREILEANVSEDADVRAVAATGTNAE
jgi:chromosome segregation ATPase